MSALESRTLGWVHLMGMVITVACVPCAAEAQMRITEYMYSGVGGEFVEFTNVGATTIDMTGWSFDDDSNIPGTVDLSGFGNVAPSESVILTESVASAFIAEWSLTDVTVIGSSSAGLSRNDAMNLYDNSDTLVDRLTYGDEDYPGSVRTNGASGWVCSQMLGANDPFGWIRSTVGDQQSSYMSVGGDVGHPGIYVDYVCPANPTGACCSAGNCNVMTEAECTGLGLWQGDGTNCAIACPQPTDAAIRITEYMHLGTGTAPNMEFIEFTNIGSVAVDMAGWSFDDESRIPGQFDLSALGTVEPGASFILTEASETAFSTDWGLTGVAVVGNLVDANLGGNDEINVYDSSGALVDQLTYGSTAFPGSIDASGVSGWACAGAMDLNDIINDIYNWRLSVVGDEQSSIVSLLGAVGSPGTFAAFGCETVNGSCCVAGVCSNLIGSDCALAHGVYLGDGTNCTADPCPAPTNANVRITEYMYSDLTGTDGEFIEFTNLGATPVDMSGWSFTDEIDVPGAVDLTGFGTVTPGESVILTEDSVAAFTVKWALADVTAIVMAGGGALARNDEINVYDPSGTRVDRLQFGDNDAFPGTIRAQGASGWPCAQIVGGNDIYEWRLSAVGDQQSSYASSEGNVGSPGTYVNYTCPTETGSCCVAGVCSDLTEGDCLIGHGLYLGNGTSCTTDPCPAPSGALVRITEYMYAGVGGEFVEFTNLDNASVDMSGWSFTDSGDVPGAVDLGGFGIVAPGESVILCEFPAVTFAVDWGLSDVKILILPEGELGRNDIINLYDSSGTLVDRLQYGDEDFPGSIRTQGISGWPEAFAVGQNQIFSWVRSSISDAQESYASANADVGNPGTFIVVDNGVPAISTWGLAIAALALLITGTAIIRRAARTVSESPRA